MKKLTVKEFSRYFSKYSGETVVVTRRGVEIGVWTPGPRADVDNEKNVEVRPVKPGEEIKCVKPEDKPVVQNSVVDQLRAQVSEIENRGKIQQVDSLPPIPEVWHKEELEEEEEEKKFVVCEVCREGRAEKTFYDAGGAGEVEICRQCARMKYAGSMRTFDGYWKKLQDINLY